MREHRASPDETDAHVSERSFSTMRNLSIIVATFILLLAIQSFPSTISFELISSVSPRVSCKVSSIKSHRSCQLRSVGTWGLYPNSCACPTRQLLIKATVQEGEETSAQEEDSIKNIEETNQTKNRIDQVLSRLTSLFPFFVVSAAILATYRPSTLEWVNNGSTITIMLASVMIGMGMTLTKSDFDVVFQSNQIRSVPIGVLCQFGIMPLSALLVGKYIMKLQTRNPSLYLGLVLVGSSPGGTASNLVSLIANADVALSVVLTSCSTILASLVTPLLVKLLADTGANVSISGWALCIATAKVVLAPILVGMTLNAKAPRLCRWVSRFTPFASVVLVSLICGGVVAQNATVTVGMGGNVLRTTLLSVLLLHTIGFVAGYIIPRKVLRCDERTSRTVSIETGMQNSALACVLARSIVGADPLSSLPGALSATIHSCLGSMLAAFWRARGDGKGEKDPENE